MYKLQTTSVIFFFLLFSSSFYAQVGINTNSPQAMLDIHSGGTTDETLAFTVRNDLGKRLFGVRDNGWVSGAGVDRPKVALDLRNADGDGCLKVASTALEPSVVGKGVLKYGSANKMELTNGSEWMELEADHVRSYVVASVSDDTQHFASGGESVIANWEVESEVGACFDAVTGVFRAKRAAIYSVTINMTFKSVVVTGNSRVLLSLNGSGNQVVKCITTCESSGTYPVGVICSGNFKLNTGETISASILQNVGNELHVDKEYCDLGIVEF